MSVTSAPTSAVTLAPRHHFVFNHLRSVEKGQYVKIFSAEVLETVLEKELKRAADLTASGDSTPVSSVFPSAPVAQAAVEEPQLTGEIGVVEDVTFFTNGELRRVDDGDDSEEEEMHHQVANTHHNHYQPNPFSSNFLPQKQLQSGAAFHSYNGGGKSKNNNNNHHHPHHYNQQHQQLHNPRGGVSGRGGRGGKNGRGGVGKNNNSNDSAVASTLIKSISIKARSGFSVESPLDNIRRAYLVVLDLNGILGARDKGQFVPRPNLHIFLKFIFEHFLVAVWTSGVQKNADVIIKDLFGPQRNNGIDFSKRLLFTWYRDQTTPNPTPDKPYGTIKDLSNIFNNFPASFHPANTIIVDDSPEKCTHPSLSLCPTAFTEEDARKWLVRMAAEGDTSIANTPIMLGGNSGHLKKQNSSLFPSSPQAAMTERQHSALHMNSTTKYVLSGDQERRGLQYVQRVLERVLVEDNLHAVYEAAEERLEEAYRDQKIENRDSTPNSLAQKESTLEQLNRMMMETRARMVETKLSPPPALMPPSKSDDASAITTTSHHPSIPLPRHHHHNTIKPPSPVDEPPTMANAASTSHPTTTVKAVTHQVLSSVGGRGGMARYAGDDDDDDEDDEFLYAQMVVE